MKVQELNPSEVTWLGEMQEADRKLHEAYVGKLVHGAGRLLHAMTRTA